MLHCKFCGERETEMEEVEYKKVSTPVPYGDRNVELITYEGEGDYICPCGEILSKDDMIETEEYSSEEVSEFFEDSFKEDVNEELASAFELILAGEFKLAGKMIQTLKNPWR